MAERLIRSYMRRARKRASLTQKQLASQINIPLRRYVDIEGGKEDISPELLQAVAKYLEANLWLMQRDEKEFQTDRRRYERERRRIDTGHTIA